MLLMHNLSHRSLHQMESAICLRYRPLPYVSKGFEGASARPSRFHLRFNHATPVSLPHFSTPRGPITRSFRHATCMFERFSESSHNNEGSGSKILRGITGASLVLACVLGLLNFSGKVNTKFTTAYADTSKFSFQFQSGNKKILPDVRDALDSLLKTIDETESIETELKGDSELVKKIKLCAFGEPNTGQKAVEFIKAQYKHCKEINCQSKHSLGLALVEGLMFQRNYKEASKMLDKQINQLLKENETDESLKKDSESVRLVKLHTDTPFHLVGQQAAELILYKAIVEQALEKEKDLRKSELKAIIAEARKIKIRGPAKALPEWKKALRQIYN